MKYYAPGHNEDQPPLINNKRVHPKKSPQEILIMGAEFRVKVPNNIPIKLFDRRIHGKVLIFPLH
jgi:hypothetical protein